jgi:hypothetical protein
MPDEMFHDWKSIRMKEEEAYYKFNFSFLVGFFEILSQEAGTADTSQAPELTPCFLVRSVLLIFF